MFRLLSSLLLVLILSGAASCNQDKSETAPLIGAWNITAIDNQSEAKNTATDLFLAIFTASGITQLVVTDSTRFELLDKEGRQVTTGTYSVNGDRLSTKMADGSEDSSTRIETKSKDEVTLVAKGVSINLKRGAARR